MAELGRWLAVALSVGLSTGCPKQETKLERASSDSPGGLAPVVSVAPGADGAQPSAFAERVAERESMVREQLKDRDINDPRVLAAMRKVPRHRFVPESSQGDGYADRPLPIGNGQTISQPYIVAFMTQAAMPKPHDRCLEIGTGSGYQAAILAELCERTYSIEYLAEVARFGEQNLRALGYASPRVMLRVGDGYQGWPEAAPFDVVLVTAAPDHVPRPLLDQLAIGGRLVIPVGPDSANQELERWTRVRAGGGDEAFRREHLMGVRFVPFLGERAKNKR
jgi:protein-L-isoaspartate(D-aspartate) O-methyltransferase